jgi:hypothetical protein
MRLHRSFALAIVALTAAGCKTVSTGAEVKDFPPGAVGLPVQPAVFALEGAAARAIYDKLTLSAETDAYGSNKTYYGYASLHCQRTGGGLPPGAQGLPAPATFRCGMGAMIPPGAQGFPPPPFLKVDGQTARELFAAINVEEVDEGASGSKSFSGEVAFYCGYTLENGVRTNDYCRLTSDSFDGSGGGDGSGIPDGAQGQPVMPDDGYDGGIPPGAQGLPVLPDDE